MIFIVFDKSGGVKSWTIWQNPNKLSKREIFSCDGNFERFFSATVTLKNLSLKTKFDTLNLRFLLEILLEIAKLNKLICVIFKGGICKRLSTRRMVCHRQVHCPPKRSSLLLCWSHAGNPAIILPL